MKELINIACGSSYLPGWRNFDYTPHSPHVTKANLLGKLPLEKDIADVVYSSHFFEHIPRTNVNSFLSECFRITKSGGQLRLVLPDFEEMCSSYLMHRRNNDRAKAEFLILEIIDQCVRQTTGGELGAFYESLKNEGAENQDIINFVKERTGCVIRQDDTIRKRNWRNLLNRPSSIWKAFENIYIRSFLRMLPDAFSRQNVSLATVGERHAWVYDFDSVEKLLISAGFVGVQRMTASTSNIENFPCYPLDVYEDFSPRKGAESMYVEAVKP